MTGARTTGGTGGGTGGGGAGAGTGTETDSSNVLVAMYVMTAGLQGNALGSDEEEITLLVYVVIDVPQNKVM